LDLPINQCHQSGRCEEHVKQIKHRFRPRYHGINIPIEVSHPIRAGNFFDVYKVKLRELIVELIMSLDGPDKFSLETQSSRAEFYIGIISGADIVEILYNCFWGDGMMHRGLWVPYQWNKSKHRSNCGVFRIFMFKCFI
jgi:hypothetical protein